MSTDYIKILGFHPAIDGQYFECLYSDGQTLYETAAFGPVIVGADGLTKSVGDLSRIGDVYIYRNYTVSLTVDWHEEGEFSVTALSDDDADFWYSIGLAQHDFFTVATRASRCYLGVVHKWSFTSAGDLMRVKRHDYRVAGRHLVTISDWRVGFMFESSKYENDVLVKHRRRTISGLTYCEILDRIRDEDVVLRVVASGTVGNKSSHSVFEIYTPEGIVPPQHPTHIEVYAL